MTNSKTPTTEQYQRYLESYGPDLQRWPNIDLADAANWLASNAAAQDELAEQTQLDTLLFASLDGIKAPNGLSEKILSSLEDEDEKDTSTNILDFRQPFSARAFAPLFAAAFVGILLGAYLPEFLLPDNSATTDDIILYESFIDWDGEIDNG